MIATQQFVASSLLFCAVDAGEVEGTVADASAMGPVMICAIAICEFIGLSWLLFGCVAVCGDGGGTSGALKINIYHSYILF